MVCWVCVDGMSNLVASAGSTNINVSGGDERGTLEASPAQVFTRICFRSDIARRVLACVHFSRYSERWSLRLTSRIGFYC